jgi:hypothetical protein
MPQEPEEPTKGVAMSDRRKELDALHRDLFTIACAIPQGTYLSLQEWATENAPLHWIGDEEVDLNAHHEIIELFQTGSVTTEVGDRKFEVSLIVKEVTK